MSGFVTIEFAGFFSNQEQVINFSWDLPRDSSRLPRPPKTSRDKMLIIELYCFVMSLLIRFALSFRATPGNPASFKNISLGLGKNIFHYICASAQKIQALLANVFLSFFILYKKCHFSNIN